MKTKEPDVLKFKSLLKKEKDWVDVSQNRMDEWPIKVSVGTQTP